MQAKHGIFCIDELPVLDPRKQVALLSVLQEGRFTTGSYPIIFEPRTTFFATANPIDYTHSGKVIEPLYDRLKSHIHTHYPKTITDEMLIILQEANISKSFILVSILEALATAIQKTRNTSQVNQERGVSVRLGVHGLELLVGEAQRTRALFHKLIPTPRLSDMHCLNQVAKFELAEMDDTVENRHKVFSKIIADSIKETCLRLLENTDHTLLESIKQEFGQNTFETSQKMIWSNGKASYHSQLEIFPSLKKLVEAKLEHIQQKQNEFAKAAKPHNISVESLEVTDENELRCALTEIILEGLCWTTPKILDKKEAGYVAA
jgi:magnesium chelatase subunit I